MPLADASLITPNAGLMIWTVVTVIIAAVIAWIVLVVAPRPLSASVGRWAKRRWPGP